MGVKDLITKFIQKLNPEELKEEWLPIKDYPDYYVSNHGRIRSHKRKEPKIIGPHLRGKGYKLIVIRKDNKQKGLVIRHLVKDTFGFDLPDEFDVFWQGRGKRGAPKKLTKSQVEEIRKDTSLTVRKAGEKYGVSYQMISYIRRNEVWKE